MKTIFSILLSICILSSLFSGAVRAEENVVYGDVDQVTIDHVIYKRSLSTDRSISDYYTVCRFFDCLEYAKNSSEINVVDSINGVPVKVIGSDACFAYGLNIIRHPINITKVNLPDTIEKIEEYAFSGLRKVKALDLPDSLEIIGPRAFNYMSSLESITIPKDVTVIDEGAFAYCKSLKKVNFKGMVTRISDNAFVNCKNLKRLKLPKTLESIGESAFGGSGIENIKIPADIYLSEYVFENCTALKKAVYTGSVGKDGVFYISGSSFFDCSKLEKVYLPKSAKEIHIGDYAFYNCRSLKKIYNASKIAEISKSAFENCKSLVSFTVTSKIKKIEDESFKNCKSLKKLKVLTKKAKIFNGKEIFKGVPKTCKAYVKTKAVKEAIINSGFKGRVIVNKNLK